MVVLSMLSPAKINLGLDILYKRPDNYHEINSVFLRLNWGDDIRFEWTETNTVELISTNQLMSEKYPLFEEVSERGFFSKNILFKAYQWAKQFYDTLGGVKIFLTKRIPPGGGLGGGSSNAAELIKFLLSDKINVTDRSFGMRASQIGADVPFFLSPGRHSKVSGIGEVVEEITVAEGYGLLCVPPFSISTKDAYKYLKKPLQKTWVGKQWKFLTGQVRAAISVGDWSLLRKVVNEFEGYAFQQSPELEQLKGTLYAFGCDYVSMTGSGSSIYSLCKDADRVQEVMRKVSQKYLGYKFISFTF
jgi:4-diphosphocytidyl-2-C-methyl-D-erythritol kinase